MEIPQEDPLAVYCFCVCSGSVLLGDLIEVSRSRERDLLSVLLIYLRIFFACIHCVSSVNRVSLCVIAFCLWHDVAYLCWNVKQQQNKRHRCVWVSAGLRLSETFLNNESVCLIVCWDMPCFIACAFRASAHGRLCVVNSSSVQYCACVSYRS